MSETNQSLVAPSCPASRSRSKKPSSIPSSSNAIKKMGLFVELPTTTFKEFQERSSRLLIALNDHDQFSPTLIELEPDKTEVFRADFTLLRDPEKVLETVRETVDSMPANVRQVHTFRMTVPQEALAETKFGPDMRLSVPVDERLEKVAIEFLGSKNYIKRWEAVQALRYFKSNANTGRLRAILDDSGYSQDGNH